MAGLNAAGIQMAYGAIAQAWEDSSPVLVIAEGLGRGARRHTHYDMAEPAREHTRGRDVRSNPPLPTGAVRKSTLG
jgi:hypothetical protein